MPLDLSKTSLDELVSIHNEVLRNIALQTKASLGNLSSAAGHDSHGSNHSNNKITDMQAHLQQVSNQQHR